MSDPPFPYTVREFRTKSYICSAESEKAAEAVCARLYRTTARHHYWEKTT